MQLVNDLNGRFAGKPVWVVLAGTSLRGFPFEALEDKITIAVNDLILHMKKPTIHIFNDRKLVYRYGDSPQWKDNNFWKRTVCSRKKGWRWADGQIVVCRKNCVIGLEKDPANARLDVYVYHHNPPQIKYKSNQLFCRSTIATAAVQVAWRIGASEVNLLGCDCYKKGEARYFYEPFEDDDPIHLHPERKDKDYLQDWDLLKEWLKKTAPDLPVTNYSPLSACEVFKKADWRDRFPPQ
jgi:hypothetical protein